MQHAAHRWITTIAAVALAATGLVGTPRSASAADPVTTSASTPSGEVSIDYSDTTVAPGDLVVADVTFTNPTGDPQDAFYQLGSSTQGFSDLFTLSYCLAPVGTVFACQVSTDGTALRVSVDALPPGDKTLTVGLTVKPGAASGTYGYLQGLVFGIASTTSFSPALSFTIQNPAADLAVDLDATPGSLLTSQINYALAVTNNGPAATTASSVQVALPAQTTSVTGLPSGCTYASATDIVTCNTGAIANTATANRTFTANLGLLTLGPLNATATRVSSTPTDPNPANDTATAACTALTSLIITC